MIETFCAALLRLGAYNDIDRHTCKAVFLLVLYLVRTNHDVRTLLLLHRPHIGNRQKARMGFPRA